MFNVYIIYSLKIDRFYVGYTEDVAARLLQHNSGLSDFTSVATDWTLKHTEPFQTREAAMKREREIKKKKSRKYIEWLISSAG
jgi:putative endonuclease